MNVDGLAPFRAESLDGAPPALVAALQALAEPVTLSRGQILFEQGDPGDAIFALNEGLLEVSVFSAEGRKLTLSTLGPGDVFGEIALLDQGPRTASVTARTDSRLSRVRRQALLDQIAARPELAADLLAFVGRRLRRIAEDMQDAVLLQAAPRLARRLLALAGRFAGPDGTLAFSQAELAEHIGATREAVSKILSSWRQRGWVDLARGRIIVKDPAALEGEAAREIL